MPLVPYVLVRERETRDRKRVEAYREDTLTLPYMYQYSVLVLFLQRRGYIGRKQKPNTNGARRSTVKMLRRKRATMKI